MNKILKLAALGAVMGLSLASVGAAKATTLVDIVDYIDDTDGGGPDTGAGEQAVMGPITVDGLLFNATGYNSDAGNPDATLTTGPYAYLDGGSAGMGVCQALSGTQCSVPSDDNVTGNNPTEVLSLNFFENITIEELYFRDDGHDATFPPGAMIDIYINGTILSTYTLATNAVGSAIGAVLVGFTDIVLNVGDELQMGYENQQFYLAGFEFTPGGGETTPVPLPAGLLLLLSGLLGLGFLGRFKAKVA